MNSKRVGKYHSLGSRAGAIVAGAPEELADLYGEFGISLGVLVQNSQSANAETASL